MANQSAATTAGRPMITESEMVRPLPAAARMVSAISAVSPLRSTSYASTNAWPANSAAKANRPHRAVPQNFQTCRLGNAGGTRTGGFSRVRESIKKPSRGRKFSRQRSRQKRAHIVIGEIDRAIHAGVIGRKARRRKQLRTVRRHPVQRGGGRKQCQFLDRKTRHALAVGPTEGLADAGDRLACSGQALRLISQLAQHRERRVCLA